MGGKSGIKSGRLSIRIRGLIKDKNLPEKWAVLYDGGSDQSPPRFELFDQENGQASKKPSRVILLENVKWVDKSFLSKEQPYFELSIRKEKHFFLAENQEEKDEWVGSLCIACNELSKQRAKEIDVSQLDTSESDGMSDNTLYDTSQKALQFKVSIDPTKASEANNLRGNYFLMPTQDSLQLLESIGQKCVCDWQYRQIRKFGKSKQCFRMEVGRTSLTGEGEFVFFTVDGESIVHFINIYTRLLQQRDLQVQSKAKQTLDSPGKNVSNSHQTTSVASSSSTVETSKEALSSEALGTSPCPPPVRPRSCSTAAQLEQAKPHASNDKLDKTRSSSDKSDKTRSSAGKGSSAEVKIYETSSGLTAPLQPEFHTELQKKMKDQKGSEDQVCTSGSATPSSANSMGISWPDPGDSKDYDIDERPGESIAPHKEKKRSEKESKKKREKEEKAAEARRKKEMKDQKEKDKKQKKEKGHEKVQASKSLSTRERSNIPSSEGHIYDEPEVLVIQNIPGKHPSDIKVDLAPQTADLYTDVISIPKSAPQESGGDCLYASPIKLNNAWKVHARPDSAAVHQEDYNKIKIAYTSQRQHSEPRPGIPPYFHSSTSEASQADTEVYDRLGQFDMQNSQKSSQSEGIYGIASAVQTVKPKLPLPVAAGQPGGEYEETDVGVLPPGGRGALCESAARGLRNAYEEPEAVQPTSRIKYTADSEYADIS